MKKDTMNLVKLLAWWSRTHVQGMQRWVFAAIVLGLLFAVASLSLREHGETNAEVIGGADDSLLSLTPRERQIQTYRQTNGTKSLKLQIHVTHHGGTFLCQLMTDLSAEVPPLNCENILQELYSGHDVQGFPWLNDSETNTMVPVIRQFYHFISYEFRYPTAKRPLRDTYLEHPNLISIYITRHPIDRAISGDGNINRRFGRMENRTVDQWWEFAHDWTTHNYALDVLSDSRVKPTVTNHSREAVKDAKRLLQRFTYVLDISCLMDGVTAMLHDLGHVEYSVAEFRKRNSESRLEDRASAQERIGNDTIYDLMMERNRYDIQVHEFAKSISLVKC